MSINLTSNFSEQAALPLDDRTQFVDIVERNALPAGRRYAGLICWVKSVEKLYVLRNDLITWYEICTDAEEIYALYAGDDFYNYIYFGAFDSNGSFRIILDSGYLKIEKRIAAIWETINEFTADDHSPTNSLVTTYSGSPVPYDGDDLYPYFHIGSYVTNGSFRIVNDSGDLKFEQQILGIWKTVISIEEFVSAPVNTTTTFDTTANVPIVGDDARPFVHVGAKASDGTFRFIVDSGALKIEKRISGSWYTLQKYEE